MWDFIERLREGPESQRRRFALFVAFSLTGIVFVAWLMSFSAGKNVYTKVPEATSTSPLASIGDAVKQGTELFKDIQTIISESRAQLAATTSTSTTPQ